jgi:hypothetical protein
VAIVAIAVGVTAAVAPTASASQAPNPFRPLVSVSPAEATPGSAPSVAGPVSPTSLEFAPQQPFTSSAPQVLTFTNTTGAPVDLQSSVQPNEGVLSLSGCSNGQVPAGKSCTINVVFHPPFGGPPTGTTGIVLFAGSVTFARVPVTYHILPIVFCQSTVCSGETPLTALNLGSVLDGRTSPDVTLTLRNFWPVDTSITDIRTTAGSGFIIGANTCGALPSGSTCTVALRYMPGLHVGPAADNLTVTGPWGGPGAENIALSAVGLAAPILSVSPASLTFPTPQQSGTSSVPQTVTVTNVGTAAMRLDAFITTGGLAENYIVTDCGEAPIPPGKACPISIVYRPVGDAVTPRSADLQLFDPQVAGSGILVPITTGFVLPLGFDPTSLTFPPTPVDRVSAPQTIAVRNFYIDSGVTVIGFRLPPDFEVTEFTCTGPIASGARCQIVVRAHPTKAGPLSGDLVISLSGAVYGTLATETVHLSGMGTGERSR